MKAPGLNALGLGALQEMAAGLAASGRVVPTDPDGDPEAARSIRLLGTRDYDAWLVSWPAGSGKRRHGHEGSTSVAHVVSGTLSERTGDGQQRLLGPGQVTSCRPWQTHELWNRTGTEATSVHVYSPPLVSSGRTPAEATAPAEPDRWKVTT
jgi:quercetin dioxygenase-like cupin family protein